MKTLKIYRFLILAAIFSITACGPQTAYLTAEDPGTATIRIYKNNNSTSKNRYIAPKNVELKYTHNDLNGKLISGFASHCPSVGDVNLLVIPVQVPGSDFFVSDAQRAIAKQDIELAFFGDDNEKLNYPSMKNFYKESSFGKLNLNGTVTDWFKLDEHTSIKNSSQVKEGVDGTISNEILLKAVEWAKTNQGIDLTKFDNDQDGAIDGVWLVYDHPDYVSQYQYYLKNEIEFSQNDINTSFWNHTYQSFSSGFGETTSTDPVAVPYSWISVWQLYTGYAQRDENGFDILDDFGELKIGTHTLIHEQGHLFGLPDFYSTTTQNYSPAGQNTMMDMNVCDLDSYSKMVLGWVTPYVVYGTSEILLPKANYADNCVIVIPSNFNDISNEIETLSKQNKLENYVYEFNPFSEYLMIDLYTPDGLNYKDTFEKPINDREYGIADSGVRIYHVDSRIFKANVIQSDLGVSLNYVEGYEWNGGSINKNQAILCPISNSKIENSNYQLPIEFDNYDRIRLIEATGFNSFNEGGYAQTSTLFTPRTNPFEIEKFGYRFFNSNYSFNDGNDLPFKIKVETLKEVAI